MPVDLLTCVGSHDVLFITLDTLRYDVAAAQMEAGQTPTLKAVIGQWECRHTPASFTYAAHQAFFAGHLPTPISGDGPGYLLGNHPTLVAGLRAEGYYSVCIGGVGFFNKLSPLGCVLPGLFDESHWSVEMSVTHHDSTRQQVGRALSVLDARPPGQRVFLFLNVSALHQPNYMYLPGATIDSIDSHAAALRYVDGELGPLFAAFRRRGPTFVILCADHGTAYGEDGYTGHRIAHPVVWTVPYAECELS